jgi:hypothetical protein
VAHLCFSQIVKYKTKPEKRSETFKNLMRQVVLDADAETSLHGLCSQMINLFTGNRDYGDVECCHLLQQLPLMEWSVVFGETFHMDGRRRLDSSGDEGSDAFTASLEEWYINRPAELEQLHSFALLSMFESTGRSYTRITHGPPKVPHYSPFVEMRYSIPPSLAAAANPGAFSSSTKKHEAYCEQRLVMVMLAVNMLPLKHAATLCSCPLTFTSSATCTLFLAWNASNTDSKFTAACTVPAISEAIRPEGDWWTVLLHVRRGVPGMLRAASAVRQVRGISVGASATAGRGNSGCRRRGAERG